MGVWQEGCEPRGQRRLEEAAAGLRHAASCLSMIVVVKVAIPLGSGQQCAGSQGGNDSVQRIMDRVTEMEFRHANDATTEE